MASWYFVTRDLRAEKKILRTRDLLLEGALWNATAHRVKDAVSLDMETEVDLWNNGREVTAALDVLNAFMLLSQPILHDGIRRAQFLTDMQRLAEILIEGFFR